MSSRIITVPGHVLKRAWIHSGDPGVQLLYPVCVNWPELRLTEEQQLANIMARLDNRPVPHPDHSIFTVALDRFE